MSSLFDAAGLGINPFSFSFSAMHKSMSRVFGLIGRNAHQLRSASVMTMPAGLVVGAAATDAASAGQGAPILIHLVRSSICRWESFFLGGIWRSASVYRTALMRRESSGLLGMMTA